MALEEPYSNFRREGDFNRQGGYTIPDPQNQNALGWHTAAFKVIERCLKRADLKGWKIKRDPYIMVRKHEKHWKRFVNLATSRDKDGSSIRLKKCKCRVCKGSL